MSRYTPRYDLVHQAYGAYAREMEETLPSATNLGPISAMEAMESVLEWVTDNAVQMTFNDAGELIGLVLDLKLNTEVSDG